ncbi:hypothetical protein [Dongia rigui]|uniref:Uncharacterized protein n=1 Tax=Dongia rigui TaxID=940149 RepID=A0ABU5E0I8_9PROT|nr:hypothetical protein [Dongia rigui]MDY0873107.1 hypothetical protein [Dongia rigui]
MRYEEASRREDKIDHIVNFALAISHVAEWQWYTTLQHHPRWKHLSLSAFRRYAFAMEPALGYMETICISAKHPELDSHRPEFGDAAATATLDLIELRPAPETGEPKPVYLLNEDYTFSGGEHFVQDFLGLALDSMSFWRQFDPDHSPV